MSMAVPWLLSAKVAVPARVDAYFNRSQPFEWSEATGSGIVVVQAPGGFGKTTLLAEVYRRERERGVLAAWLTLDEDDTAESVAAYLAYAFERAGLETPSASDAFEHSVGLVARSIEAHAEPCLLVLDEVERATTGAVAALDFLLRHHPRQSPRSDRNAGKPGSRPGVGHAEWARCRLDSRPVALLQTGDHRFLWRGTVAT